MPSAAALAIVHAGSKKDLRLRVGTYGKSELHARRAFRSQGLCPAIPVLRIISPAIVQQAKE
jgi:hypothetical protein